MDGAKEKIQKEFNRGKKRYLVTIHVYSMNKILTLVLKRNVVIYLKEV